MTSMRIAVVGLASAITLALGVVLLAMTPEASRLPPGGRLVPVLVVVIAWGFFALGSLAAVRRPDNRTGTLMCGFGFAVLISGFVISDEPLLYLISAPADALALALFVHLLVSLPTGTVHGRTARLVVGGSA